MKLKNKSKKKWRKKNLSQPRLIQLTRHPRYEIRIKNKLLIKDCPIGRQSQKK
jgi:hypothetical protein